MLWFADAVCLRCSMLQCRLEICTLIFVPHHVGTNTQVTQVPLWFVRWALREEGSCLQVGVT